MTLPIVDTYQFLSSYISTSDSGKDNNHRKSHSAHTLAHARARPCTHTHTHKRAHVNTLQKRSHGHFTMMTASGYVCEPCQNYQISFLLNNESPSVMGEEEAEREQQTSPPRLSTQKYRFRAQQGERLQSIDGTKFSLISTYAQSFIRHLIPLFYI